MRFLYIPIFCVITLPVRGYITFSLLRSPESTSDNLDLKIDGSIDLGSNWHYSDVRNAISKIGQSFRIDDPDAAKKNHELEKTKDMSENRQLNKFVGYLASSGLLQQYRDGESDKRDLKLVMSESRDAVQKGESSDSKDNSVQWDDRDMSDNVNVQRQGEDMSETKDKVSREPKRHKDGIVGVTQFARTKNTEHKVKDDERTKEFSVHVLKQTMEVFESIKRKIGNSDMKAKVDEVARSYKDQFGDFVRQQRDTSIRTKTGDQRAILHTMDTSNLILQRLVNFLKADLGSADSGRQDSMLQREVDAARELEYKHVCSKYGYCRSDEGFTTMLQNCIKVLLNVDDEKMYRARDALTEVLKTGDYSKLIDSKTDKTFRQKINRLERQEPENLREALRVLLGMLSNPQTPLVEDGENPEVVRKTAAFYTLLAMWEDVMPGDESNKLEWADIERSLGDWSSGKRTDIHEIIQALERNMKRGFKKIDPDTEVKMKEQVKIIRG